MSTSDLTESLDSVGTPSDDEPDHDPTNGRWLEGRVADALNDWGYRTTRNEQLFGLETDIIARQNTLNGEPDDFIVVECKDWHQTPVQREAVETIALRAALARAMPVLAVARTVSDAAWKQAQLLDVRIITQSDLRKDQLPPLTRRRPPWGTLRTQREPTVHALRDQPPELLKRAPSLDIESPVYLGTGQGPCYVPDRSGNDAYVRSYETDYDFE